MIERTRDELEAELRDVRRRALLLRRELVERLTALATAAFGLVAALAWNNAVQALFKRYYPAPNDPAALAPLVGYALFVTLVAVVVIMWISRIAGRLKNAEVKAADAAK